MGILKTNFAVIAIVAKSLAVEEQIEGKETINSQNERRFVCKKIAQDPVEFSIPYLQLQYSHRLSLISSSNN